MKNNICAEIRSYILYLLLLTVCHRAFGFTLDIKIKVRFGLYMPSFNLLRFRSTPYNRSLTCAWFNLRYNKEKYTKISVVLFPVVLKVTNFLLPYFCSVVSLLCRKPVVWIFSTNYARFFCSQLGGVVLCVFICYFFCNCARGFYYSGYALMSCDFWGML